MQSSTAAQQPAAHGPQGRGLSNSYISPAPTLRLAAGGTLLDVKGCRPGLPIVRRGAPRGKCGLYNRRMRSRLFRRLAEIPWRKFDRRVWFVTLTYPASWPADPAQWKRDLDNWFKSAHARYPQAAWVWRLEPQARGAPHYHLLAFGLPSLPRKWLSQSWYDAVGSGDPKHLKAGTNRQRVRTWRGVLSYAAKYVGSLEKVDAPPGWEAVGRYWGIRWADNLGIDVQVIELTGEQFFQCRRLLIRWMRAGWRESRRRAGRRRPRGCRNRYGGIWAFAPADYQIDILRYLGLAVWPLPTSTNSYVPAKPETN